MPHANPMGLIQSCLISIMHEHSMGELLARDAFMHHDDNNI